MNRLKDEVIEAVKEVYTTLGLGMMNLSTIMPLK